MRLYMASGPQILINAKRKNIKKREKIEKEEDKQEEEYLALI